jgi:hypothetical protein
MSSEVVLLAMLLGNQMGVPSEVVQFGGRWVVLVM